MAETQQYPQPSLSTIGVLREAFKTTRRNGKLAASILLLVICYSFPVKLTTNLLRKEVTTDWHSSNFETWDAGSFQWENQQAITQTGGVQSIPYALRDIPSSYSYMSQSTPMDDIRGIRSSQRGNPSSYGYMDQNVLRSSQQPKSGSYRNTGQSRPISSQRQDPGSYSTYMDQFMPSGRIKAIRANLMLDMLAQAGFWLISLIFSVAAIASSYEAHTAKPMSLRDVFLKFGESWKRPIHTSFCFVLISFGFFVLLLLISGLILVFAEGYTVYILYAVLAVSSFLTYLHMSARWMLSIVVSVLESDSSGLKAIDRAGDLMKGKQIQASLLIILSHLAMGAVQIMSTALTKKHDGWLKMAITMPFTLGLISVVKFLMFAIYTVYYHDRTMSHKEEGLRGQFGLYVPVTSGEV